MRQIFSSNISILEALQQLSPESSKTTLRSWLEQGRVLVGGAIVKNARTVVKKGERVEVGKKITFLDYEVELLYADRDIAVIAKPEGLLSVATDYEKNRTAHKAVKNHFKGYLVTPVHRLDRDTSGVLVFALSEMAKDGLKEQFFEHTVKREYTAIVEGTLEQKKGTWESCLLEDETYFVKSHPSGEKAITKYEVLSSNGRYSCLKLSLKTGKKNQIRVHTSEAGFPIIGDTKYGAKTNPISRMGLHAHLLSFIHPRTKKKMEFKKPAPESFSRVCSK